MQLKTINTAIHIQDAEHDDSTKPAISSGPAEEASMQLKTINTPAPSRMPSKEANVKTH